MGVPELLLDEPAGIGRNVEDGGNPLEPVDVASVEVDPQELVLAQTGDQPRGQLDVPVRALGVVEAGPVGCA